MQGEPLIVNRRHKSKTSFVFFLCLIAGSIYLLNNLPAFLTFDKALLGLAIIWVSSLSILQYFLDFNRSCIPFFPAVNLFYLVSFGLPIFIIKGESLGRFQVYNVTSTALILVLLGITGMNIAFYVSQVSIWQKTHSFHLKMPETKSQNYRFIILLWVLLVTQVSFLFFRSTGGGIPSLRQFLGSAIYVAYGLFYILWRRKKLSFVQACLIAGLFSFEMIIRFSSGILSEVMFLSFFLILVEFYEKKRIHIFWVSILIAFFILFSPIKHEFRNLTWESNEENQTTISKANLFWRLFIKYYTSFDLLEVEQSGEATKNRVALISILSAVINDTPDFVPYWNGGSYTTLFTNLIPRIFWPDKPGNTIGNEFGQRYGYLDSTDYSTSFNLPWIVEMYANFGAWGILIGMPLVGIFLGFLNRKFNSVIMNPLEFCIGASLLVGLILQESNFSLQVGSLLSLFLVLYWLFKIFLSVYHSQINGGNINHDSSLI